MTAGYPELIEYFVIERFLFRLSQSPHDGQFILKGALMLQLWHGARACSTRDVDLLGLGPSTVDEVAARIRAVLRQEVPDDGVQFDVDGLTADAIRTRSKYDGVRVRFVGRIGAARVSMQVDVGFGDVVTPGPTRIEYPRLLD